VLHWLSKSVPLRDVPDNGMNERFRSRTDMDLVDQFVQITVDIDPAA
jgi:hypothetical protein